MWSSIWLYSSNECVWWKTPQLSSGGSVPLNNTSIWASSVERERIPPLDGSSSINGILRGFFFKWNSGIKHSYCSGGRKAALQQTKAICLYSAGKSQSSLIIPPLELISEPRLSLSPWQPGTMYRGLLRIPNTYCHAGCRLLIELRVSWRTEARRGQTSQVWILKSISLSDFTAEKSDQDFEMDSFIFCSTRTRFGN